MISRRRGGAPLFESLKAASAERGAANAGKSSRPKHSQNELTESYKRPSHMAKFSISGRENVTRQAEVLFVQPWEAHCNIGMNFRAKQP